MRQERFANANMLQFATSVVVAFDVLVLVEGLFGGEGFGPDVRGYCSGGLANSNCLLLLSTLLTTVSLALCGFVYLAVRTRVDLGLVGLDSDEWLVGWRGALVALLARVGLTLGFGNVVVVVGYVWPTAGLILFGMCVLLGYLFIWLGNGGRKDRVAASRAEDEGEEERNVEEEGD